MILSTQTAQTHFDSQRLADEFGGKVKTEVEFDRPLSYVAVFNYQGGIRVVRVIEGDMRDCEDYASLDDFANAYGLQSFTKADQREIAVAEYLLNVDNGSVRDFGDFAETFTEKEQFRMIERLTSLAGEIAERMFATR